MTGGKSGRRTAGLPDGMDPGLSNRCRTARRGATGALTAPVRAREQARGGAVDNELVIVAPVDGRDDLTVPWSSARADPRRSRRHVVGVVGLGYVGLPT